MNIKTHLLPWVNRDGKLIIVARGLRTFAQGIIGVILAIYLTRSGFSLVQAGIILTAGVAGAAIFALLNSIVAGKLRRKSLLVSFTLLSAVGGIALIFFNNFLLLLLFAFLANLSGTSGTGAIGAIQPLEISSIASVSPEEKRTDTYSVYNFVATVGAAIGAFAAGLSIVFQNVFSIGEIDAYKLLLGIYVFILVLTAFVFSLLSPAIEVPSREQHLVNPLRLPSRKRIFTLAGLFSVDRFAGSLIQQSLIAFWFLTVFGLSVAALSVVFSTSQILEAISLWISAKIANRAGLLNTMVFTHLSSSVLLIAIAFTRSAWLAVLFWELYSFVGSMDESPRNSYTMGVVHPEERVAMASIHIAGGSITSAFGPSVSALLWNSISAGAPLIASGIIKIAYDISLYFNFHNIRPLTEEAERDGKNRASHNQPKE